MACPRPVIIVVIIALACGCSSSKHAFSDPFAPPRPAFLDPGNTTAQSVIRQYNHALAANPPANPTPKQIRDTFADDTFSVIDSNYSRFFHDHYEQRAVTDLAFDLLNLGAGFTGTIAGGKFDKTVTNALVTLFTGTKLATETNFFNKQATLAVIAKMDALRADKRLSIEANLANDVSQYPLRSAMDEMASYYRSGTVIEALTAIDHDANAAKQTSESQLSSFRRTGKFTRDSASDALQKFWKPDGVSVDVAHETAIKNAMKANGLDPSTLSITSFIFSDATRQEREKIASDLNLK